MALTSRSKFLYGYQVTLTNCAVDFRASMGGPVIQATLRLGYYSLTGLLNELSRAMNLADPDHVYTWTADRTVSLGTENRVSVSTDGPYLDLLFGSGPRASASVAYMIGFAAVDRTGATAYTGTFTSGTILISTLTGYNYLGPEFVRKAFSAVNVSASGRKESIVFQIQKFIQVQFKHEPRLAVVTGWVPFLEWAIQQRLFEFTPEIASPGVFYDVTLEKTSFDGKGTGYSLKEELPQMPGLFDLGMMTFRINEG